LDEKFDLMSFEIEEIPSQDFVYRSAAPRQRNKIGKRRFPNERCFELRKNEKGLSCNWEKYMNIEENYLYLALSQSNNKFLDYKAFRLFKLPVDLMRNHDLIEAVIHTPVFEGNPAPVGKPNNQAHCEALYPNDEEIWLYLSDYCKNNLDASECQFDLRSIDSKVNELRDKLDDTPFHRF